ncbi:hypothetical protein P167DRAFT_538373 [Morchella conica CCBAS932]|uniref:Secreted protein n=1 Tax=Morchella conica CCBAS932 TaxID=1392247 RepID=A0A3N4KJD2_9PEZI|nr:hypothetical protein P167DRAFT_538373 [Morchella conica CCBAS932]
MYAVRCTLSPSLLVTCFLAPLHLHAWLADVDVGKKELKPAELRHSSYSCWSGPSTGLPAAMALLCFPLQAKQFDKARGKKQLRGAKRRARAREEGRESAVSLCI